MLNNDAEYDDMTLPYSSFARALFMITMMLAECPVDT